MKGVKNVASRSTKDEELCLHAKGIVLKSEEKASAYLNHALGCYIAWRTDVNLGPPPPSSFPSHPSVSRFTIPPSTGPPAPPIGAYSVTSALGNIPAVPHNTSYNLETSVSASATDQVGEQVTGRASVVTLRPKIPSEDEHILKYYNGLQYILYETGYPETRDESCGDVTSKVDDNLNDRVTIVVFSAPVDCMGMLLEGSRQCPGDVMVVLSTTWLSRRPSCVFDGVDSLYVHKAIVFKSAGRSSIVVYDPPRRATYLINQFTSVCTDKLRCDGDLLEKRLDCPMNGSIDLGRYLDDKLWTRIKMAEVGVAHPETLAFTYRAPTGRYASDRAKLITIVVIDSKTGQKDAMLSHIQMFLAQPYMTRHAKIVVKPSGAMWSASVGVTFHCRADVTGIWKAAVELLAALNDEDAILVEAFYNTLERSSNSSSGSGSGSGSGSDSSSSRSSVSGSSSGRPFIAEKNATKLTTPALDWRAQNSTAARVRATVVRSSDNTAVCTKIVCGLWYNDGPVNGDNTIPTSLDTLLVMYGIMDRVERLRIQQVVARNSENLLTAIIQHESFLTIPEKGGILAQCDLIGIDFILAYVDGVVTPVGIEVNGPNCTVNCDIAEFVHPREMGETFGAFIHNLNYRSQAFLMRKKKILVIGGAAQQYNLEMVKTAAKEYDIQLIVVVPELHKAEHNNENDSVSEIVYNFADSEQDRLHAAEIVRLLAERGLKIDGCVTFCPYSASLTSRICELLSLNGPDSAASLLCLNREKTQQRLLSSSDGIPHLPLARMYATQNIRGCDLSTDEFNRKAYRSTKLIENKVNNKNKRFEILDDKTRDYVLEAPRYRVYLVLDKRKRQAAFICDVALKGETPPRGCKGSVLTMPTCAPRDFEDQLITASYQCCTEIGLVSGVFVTELWMTATGPKLIDITPALDSLYIRDWIMCLYGVDIMLAAFLIACDIRPMFFERLRDPPVKIVGFLSSELPRENSKSDNTAMTGRCDSDELMAATAMTGKQRSDVVASFRKHQNCDIPNTCAAHDDVRKHFSTLADCRERVEKLHAACLQPSSECVDNRFASYPYDCLHIEISASQLNHRCDMDCYECLADEATVDSLRKDERLKRPGAVTNLGCHHLLRVLEENDVIRVLNPVYDNAMPSEALCLIYAVNSKREVAASKVHGVISIIGLCGPRNPFDTLLDNFAEFYI